MRSIHVDTPRVRTCCETYESGEHALSCATVVVKEALRDADCTCLRKGYGHVTGCPSAMHLYPMGTQPEVVACKNCGIETVASTGGMCIHCERLSPDDRSERAHVEAHLKEKERLRLYGEVNAAALANSAERLRAEKAESLLRRARPMLADLVPKFPDAEHLCKAIDEILEPKKDTMAGIGRGTPLGIMHVTDLKMGWDPDAKTVGGLYREFVKEMGLPDAALTGVGQPARGKIRHADIGIEFNGTSGPYVVACASCGGEWRKQSDIPKFCPKS
jgi:hypothetical protein